MATHLAIAAASATILGLLRDNYPRAEFGASLPFDLYQAKDFDDPFKEGIALALWRVAPNTARRNLGTRTDALGRRFKTSLPIDLFYLVVPFAERAERQQRLLGWVLRAMEDLGPLAATHLNHYLSESNIFADSESVDLVNEPLPVADHLALWDRLKRLPPSATYVMRMVLLDSPTTLGEFPLVRQRNVDMGVLVR